MQNEKLKNIKTVVASWSGGIDSTAVVANLLNQGYHVKAISLQLTFYGKKFSLREKKARDHLFPYLQAIKAGKLECFTKKADWLWKFSPDKQEIPRRNKHIIDHLIMTEMIPHNIYNLAMGEYVGADTWLVKNHVGAHDADARALEAYIYSEYGVDYRLITLRDFGESRWKVNRLELGINIIGLDGMKKTTNCLRNFNFHCGVCYKCIERKAAFKMLNLDGDGPYLTNPIDHPSFQKYLDQMQGKEVAGTLQDFVL